MLYPYFSSSKVHMIPHGCMGIMNDLHDFGIRGRLAYFISAFLNERQFRVRVGDTLSNPHEQEMGFPQGSILSVTLFSVKINNIVSLFALVWNAFCMLTTSVFAIDLSICMPLSGSYSTC